MYLGGATSPGVAVASHVSLSDSPARVPCGGSFVDTGSLAETLPSTASAVDELLSGNDCADAPSSCDWSAAFQQVRTKLRENSERLCASHSTASDVEFFLYSLL